ncbi:MAG TPA: ABC transporter permease subunit [Deinococcales bacterium]|nr:ABC transporter permease subunit [Deinococcales bacterium]
MSTATVQVRPVPEKNLRPATARGWGAGLANLLGQELAAGFRLRPLLSQTLLWVGISAGITLMFLLAPTEGMPVAEKALVALQVFAAMLGMASGVGATIAGQGAVLDERISGTAAWILSKPASRAAFIWSKLIGRSAALLVTATVFPAAALVVCLAATGMPLPAFANLAAGAALVALHWLFFLTLAILLGSILSKRGAVIGLPLGLLFVQSMVAQLKPALAPYLPGALAVLPPVAGPNALPLAAQAITGQALATFTPVIVTGVLIVAFVAATLWWFNRQEL